MDIQIYDAQKIPNKFNPHRTIPRYIIIKLSKFKNRERILRAAVEVKITYKETPIRL